MFDEFGIAHTRPQRPRPYRRRAAPWIRGGLVVLVIAAGWLFARFNDRAQLRPDDTTAKAWLDTYDFYSARYADQIGPALDDALAGGFTRLDELFFYYSLSSNEIDHTEQMWLRFKPDALDPVVRLTSDWDRQMLSALNADGSAVVDTDVLEAARALDLHSTLQEIEADALPALRDEYDSLRFSQRFAAFARWVMLAFIVAAVWVSYPIRQRTLRAVHRDLTEYQLKLKEYTRLRSEATAGAGRAGPTEKSDAGVAIS